MPYDIAHFWLALLIVLAIGCGFGWSCGPRRLSARPSVPGCPRARSSSSSAWRWRSFASCPAVPACSLRRRSSYPSPMPSASASSSRQGRSRPRSTLRLGRRRRDTPIRTQLVQRYLVRHAEMADVIQSLRESALWERTREVFSKLGILRVRDERKAQQNAWPKKTRR